MRDKRVFVSLLVLCLPLILGGCGLSGGGETDERKDAGRGDAANKGPAQRTSTNPAATPSPGPSPATAEEFAQVKKALADKIDGRLEEVKGVNKAGEDEINRITQEATNPLTIKYKDLTEKYKSVSEEQEAFLGAIKNDIEKLSPPAQTPAAETFLTLTFTKWTAVFAFLLFLIFVGIAFLTRLLNARTRAVLKAADNTELLIKSIGGRLDGLKPSTLLVRPDGGEIPPDVRKWLEDVEVKINAVCEDAKRFTVEGRGATETPEPSQQSLTPQPTTPASGRRPGGITPDTFPIQADEYLNMMAGSTRSVRPDFATSLLLPDAEGKSGWVLVEDKEAEGGLSYVIPRQTYMQAKQDFFVHYNEYYDCERPQRGHVRIIRPAVVTRTGDGWKLDAKGELEMR